MIEDAMFRFLLVHGYRHIYMNTDTNTGTNTDTNTDTSTVSTAGQCTLHIIIFIHIIGYLRGPELEVNDV